MDDDTQPSPAADLARWLGDESRAENGAPWFDDERPARHRLATRAVLVSVLLVPWVLAGVLALRGTPATTPSVAHTSPPRDRSPSPPAATQSGAPAGPAGASRAVAAASAAPPVAPATDATAETARTPPTVSEAPAAPAAAGPTAVRLVRDAVTRVGARTSALDSATPEPPIALGGGVWLVRVHAVVLRGDRRRWHSASHEIWAAPVAMRGPTAVGLERPWRIGDLDTTITPTAWRPSDVGAPEARAALRTAGITLTGPIRLQQHARLPSVVRAVSGRRRIWLTTAPHLAVLGRHRPHHMP